MIFALFISTFLITLAQRYTQTCSRDVKRPGFYWDGQQCLKCKEPQCLCISYQGCDDCIDNFYLDPMGNGCLRCPYGCSKCCKLEKITSIICTSCQEDFQLINGVCINEKGCVRFSQHGHCIDCTNFGGYFKNETQTCASCPKGCKDCLSETYCKSCELGYFLISYYNSSKSDIIKQRVKKIKLGEELIHILLNISYFIYYLIQSSKALCYLCNTDPATNPGPGCSMCQYNEEDIIQCTSCFDGYHLNLNTSNCTQCSRNCKSCLEPVNEISKCTVCLEGMTLDDNGVSCSSCQDKIKNCLTCLKDDQNQYIQPFQCQICANTFYLSSDYLSCLPCITNATRGVRRCDDQRKLTQCEPGYLLIQLEDLNNLKNLSSKCIKNKNKCRTAFVNGSCITCETENGFLLSYKSQNDAGISLECVDCQNTIKNCKDCVTNDKYNVSCLICKPFFYLNNGGCLACTQYCAECSASGICLVCNEYYYLDSKNLCVPCNINNCSTCNQTSLNDTSITCLSCSSGWGLDLENKCWECQVGCQICNYHRQICTKCDPYYSLYMGSCIPYPENCLKANSQGFCYLCNTSILAPLKGSNTWDESFNSEEYNFEEMFEEQENQSGNQNPTPTPTPIPTPTPTPNVQFFGHIGQSIYYMSVNSYCLICSDYQTGEYNCPTDCLDDTFIVSFAIILRGFAILEIIMLYIF